MHVLGFEITHFDPVCLCFLCYFLFLEEKDIKGKIKYIFISDFNGGG